MAVLLIVTGVIGIVVGVLSGSFLAGVVVSVFLFLCGLPGLIVGYIVNGVMSYPQDRADYRQLMSDLSADMRAEEHEYLEDRRTRRLIRASRRDPVEVHYDNRQIHFHGEVK